MPSIAKPRCVNVPRTVPGKAPEQAGRCRKKAVAKGGYCRDCAKRS